MGGGANSGPSPAENVLKHTQMKAVLTEGAFSVSISFCKSIIEIL